MTHDALMSFRQFLDALRDVLVGELADAMWDALAGKFIDAFPIEVLDLFWDGVDRSGGSLLTAIGTALAGLGAVLAGTLALVGVLISTNRADQRASRALTAADRGRWQADEHHKQMLSNTQHAQKLTDLRERTEARNTRFSTIVTQLASDQPTVRIGALYALSALADEWQQEFNSAPTVRLSSTFGSNNPSPKNASKAQKGILQSISVNVPLAESIGQRDACIGLLCSYLRADPVEHQVQTSVINSTKLPKHFIRIFQRSNGGKDHREACQWAASPQSMPDREARDEAVKILVTHTCEDATYPWPGNMINLRGAHLEGSPMSHINLQGAFLDGAHLEKALLEGANFEGASLVDAHLEEAWLSGAHLENALLSGAHLNKAWLDKAYLYGSRLEGAVLVQAEIGSPDTQDEFRLATWDIRSNSKVTATWNRNTEWPCPEFDAQAIADRQLLESQTNVSD